MSRHVVAANNVPAGRFSEVEADSKPGALFVAEHLSRQHPGVSFGVYEVTPGEGAVIVASYLNGERRFTARDETPQPA